MTSLVIYWGGCCHVHKIQFWRLNSISYFLPFKIKFDLLSMWLYWRTVKSITNWSGLSWGIVCQIEFGKTSAYPIQNRLQVAWNNIAWCYSGRWTASIEFVRVALSYSEGYRHLYNSEYGWKWTTTDHWHKERKEANSNRCRTPAVVEKGQNRSRWEQ